MKHFFRSNVYPMGLVLVVIAFLGYQVMKTDNCVEVEANRVRIGSCNSIKSVK